jgi:hypothetical protein
MTKDEALKASKGVLLFMESSGRYELVEFLRPIFASGDIRTALIVHEGQEMHIPLSKLFAEGWSPTKGTDTTMNRIIKGYKRREGKI